ncbi:aspartyl/glutamyl-tRNA amidotransferase subunit A [Paucilactobacillus hokkaidonensis JCM 18461]|uniref:Glutamyl-tRNA(Gln) amidotransferase subunit A n=2 Tax=Paucilactobacillus hokkaidonensis TaxID=1193095 RepID=A0A0A1GT95_9LACO|nr:Asp-tRNA(Asn)/Glu-tRNA(Gln) amidotransferase subunit GatA [Paucilactobacillus hokkaidonensis]KRO11269.1 aspartyl glutamyl-tRNA amidotransferase subunit A [Paucilactobacillus hokkaidonensis]BAP85180.1 aspartyl/glutamyl-tRNA amidotransferase subunit A [Paucilactobacillus hokkaidonensis JCM 18461]
MDFYDTDLTSLHEDLVNKKISSTELTKATYENIAADDDQVKAFLTLNQEQALKKAAEVDKQGVAVDQLVSGIPLGVKDNIVTKDLKTTAASKILSNFTPVYDAAVIEKLKAQNFIDAGKLNLDEFAMGGSTENSAFQTTHNPWDLTRVPGGSSGGSAAAVAAGEILAAMGTDTGGSIRLPASYNGVVGMKPTYGRVSRWGIIAFGSSLDQVGWLTRSVKDNALLTSLISGHDDRDLTSSTKEVPNFAGQLNDDTNVKGLRIAVPKEYLGEGVDDNVKVVIQAALKHYESLGAIIDEVSLPNTQYGVAAYYIISSSEASSNLQRFDGIRYGVRATDVENLEDVYVRSRSEGFGDEVKRRIMLGTFSLSAGFYDAYFMKASQIRTLIRQDFEKVFEDHDLVMGPAGPTVAYKIGSNITDPKAMYMNDVLTVPVNMAGLPGMSIPAGFADNMPVGLQIIGKPFDEETMYKAAYTFEQSTDFHKQTPKLGGQN